MWRLPRWSLVAAAAIILAGCSPPEERAADVPGGAASTSSAALSASAATSDDPSLSPGQDASQTAEDTTGELTITTLSYIPCRQVGPSPRSQCGFLPLPEVTIVLTSDRAEPVTVRTGDDGTAQARVPAGSVVVTGTTVAEHAWTPEPVEVDLPGRGTEAVVLTYGRRPQAPPPPR